MSCGRDRREACAREQVDDGTITRSLHSGRQALRQLIRPHQIDGDRRRPLLFLTVKDIAIDWLRAGKSIVEKNMHGTRIHARTRFTTISMSWALPASPATPRARPPAARISAASAIILSEDRELTTTFAPASAKALATWAPIPGPAPTIRAVRRRGESGQRRSASGPCHSPV